MSRGKLKIIASLTKVKQFPCFLEKFIIFAYFYIILNFFHKVNIKFDIMIAYKSACQRFARIKEMAYISTREILAGITLTVLI